MLNILNSRDFENIQEKVFLFLVKFLNVAKKCMHQIWTQYLINSQVIMFFVKLYVSFHLIWLFLKINDSIISKGGN